MTGILLPPDGKTPVVLSAHEPELVAADAAAIGAYLGARPRPPRVAEVAATLARTRPVRRHRAVVRAGDAAELAAGLAALAAGETHPLVAASSRTVRPPTAFVFAGQGSQWPAMGADAYRGIAAYRAEADRCAAEFTAAGLASPLAYLVDGGQRRWTQLDIQGAHFIHLAGLAQVWRSRGVAPDIAVGHSLGEVAAAYAAGAVSRADAVGVVAARARVVAALPGRYGMAVLGAGADDAERLAAEIPGRLQVSVVNAASSTALSGDKDAVAAVVALAQARGVFCREVAVDFPAHTDALDALRPMLARLLPAGVFGPAQIPVIGAARGGVIAAGTDFADYWYANLRNTVRFDRAVSAAVELGAEAFIELSAHPSLRYSLTDLAGDAAVLGSGRRDRPMLDELAANIAAAAVTDPDHRWTDATAAAKPPMLPGFPGAPMRAVHLWATRQPPPPAAQPAPAIITATERWQSQPPPTRPGRRQTVAVIAAEPVDGAVAETLRGAVATHAGLHPAPPGDAETVVVIAPALRDRDPAAAAADLGCRARGGLPDYRAVVGPRCRTVWLVTTGAERIGADDGPALPAQAAFAAMHRCVGLEFRESAFAHLDMPAGRLDPATARAAADALCDPAAEVAVRGARRYARTLRERRRAAPPNPGSGPGAESVVITGGNGAIGGRYARHCIRRGARRVVLLSRSGVDPAVLDALGEGHRVEIAAPACDITDPRQLSAAAATHAGDGASLLIHAAGAARFAPHHRLTADDVDTALRAKVAGLARMTETWPLRGDARILVCSSLSGVWGGHGHGAYAAANRMLDVLTDRLRADGRDATAVRWGLWRGAGIVDADETARIERSGLLAMDPDQAASAGLGGHRDDPLIFAADRDRLQAFLDNRGGPSHAAGRGGVPVAEAVRAALADALRLGGPDAVDLDTALIDLGVDSLLALDLRNRLQHSVGGTVALARLLGGITGRELIETMQIEAMQIETRQTTAADPSNDVERVGIRA